VLRLRSAVTQEVRLLGVKPYAFEESWDVIRQMFPSDLEPLRAKAAACAGPERWAMRDAATAALDARHRLVAGVNGSTGHASRAWAA
jgi:hypothetical protein